MGRPGAGRIWFLGVNYLFLSSFALFCVLPFLLVLMVSFTQESTIVLNGYSLFPEKWSFEAYRFIFSRGSRVLGAYSISIFVTLVGTALSLFVTGMFAYVISNKKLKYAGALAFFMFFTMLFNGGLVPWYLIVTGIGLTNSVWALIFPALVSAWNAFLLRNFFNGIPEAILESARIDGAHEFFIFVRLMLPLSLPGLATIGLFYALFYWNDWWLAILLINKPDLYPLQYLLRQMMSDISFSLPVGAAAARSRMLIPKEGVRMATMIVTIGPIVLAYPFAQKYFVRGITIGAIKG